MSDPTPTNTQATITQVADETAETKAATGLVQLGSGKHTVLSSFRSRLVWVGKGASAHVRVADPYVSRKHFELLRLSNGAWFIQASAESKNPTWLNGVNLAPTDMPKGPLVVGSVIRAGRSAWVATHRDCYEPGTWCIAARNLRDFYYAALLVYRSARQAAQAIGMDPRTYLRRVHEDPKAHKLLESLKRKRHDTRPVPRSIPLIDVAVAPAHADCTDVAIAAPVSDESDDP